MKRVLLVCLLFAGTGGVKVSERNRPAHFLWPVGWDCTELSLSINFDFFRSEVQSLRMKRFWIL